MHESPIESAGLTRASAFARSLMPADLCQMFLLAGFVFLFISPSLGWWPEALSKLGAYSASQEEYRQLYVMFSGELVILTLPIRIAGAAGLFAYFFPARMPFRRILCWIFLPAFIGLLAACARLFFAFGSPPSILESRVEYALGSLRSAPQIFMRLGPAFHYTLVGVILVALAGRFARRPGMIPVPSGDSNLKFIFKGGSEGPVELQTLRFAWILIVTPLLIQLVTVGFTYAYTSMANDISAWPAWAIRVFGLFDQSLFSLIFVGVAAWAMGKRRVEVLRSSLRFPPPINLVLATIIPIFVGCSFPLFLYLQDRMHWATFGYGTYGPPSLVTYFRLPQIWSLFAVIPALAEEIAWRGYLQPRFIEFYGLGRGIFFTGVVWAAFHFTFDFGQRMSHEDALLGIARRVLMAVSISVVLGWITLWSGSVWPAAIVHGLYNILLSVGTPPPLAPWSTYTAWLLLGLALFRFWQPPEMAEAGSKVPDAIPIQPETSDFE